MDFKALFHFLSELQENNHKEWMDEHRPRYKALREDFIVWLDELGRKIQQMDPDCQIVPGRSAIMRINNNKVFHPDAPTYKDHFAAGLEGHKDHASYYLHIGLGERMAAGGFYKRGRDTVKKIHAAIDYDGGELKKIVNSKVFQDTFGALIDTDDKLKTSPKGYDQNHPHINLLRHKTFAVSHSFSRKEVLQDNFQDKVVEVYSVMKPFNDYLNRAVSV